MAKKKHTASSQRWLDEHFEDEYVKKAKKLGLRSRAVFKIEEINNKDKLIKYYIGFLSKILSDFYIIK